MNGDYRTPGETHERALSRALASALAPLGFAPKDIGPAIEAVPVVGAWARKTWNTNRAVVHLAAPPGRRPLGPLAQELKMPLGRALGYVTFFYGLGLQIVWSGEHILDRAAELDANVDRFDNQRCIVQSIFAADLAARRFVEARAWGQFVSGTFQDAIARGLDAALTFEA